MFLRITQGFWKEKRAALKHAASNNQTFSLRGIKFRVLRAELKDWVCLLGKESVVCTDQPHSWEELHYRNQGGPVWSSCFLEKLEEAQEETLSFVHLLLTYTTKIAKLLHAPAGGIFALSLHGLMWKKCTYFWYCILKSWEYATAPLECTPNS